MISIGNDDAMSDVTRRISAACYHDQRMCQRVLDLIGKRNFAFVAGHDGVDNAVVFSHAAKAIEQWRSHNLKTIAASAATIFFLLLLFIGNQGAGSFISLFIVLFVLFWLAIGALSKFFTTRRRADSFLSDLSRPMRIGAFIVGGWIFLALLGPLVALPLLGGAVAAITGVLTLPLLLAVFVPTYVTELVQRRNIHRSTLNHFTRNEWSGQSASPTSRELAALAEEIRELEAGGNVTVYSGYVPFVGAGRIVDEWDFAQRVRRLPPAGGRSDATPPPELSEHSAMGFVRDVMGYLNALELDNTDVSIRYFVDGEGAPHLPGMFKTGMRRPVGNVNPEILESKAESENLVRPYLWVSSKLWGSDLVTNTFLRVKTSQSTIFVEVAHLVEAPLDSFYEICDVNLDAQTSAARKFIRGATIAGLGNTWSGLMWDLRRSGRWRASNKEHTENLSLGQQVDYGARTSIRALFSDRVYHHYFQRMDAHRMRKSLDVHLLNALDKSLQRMGLEIVDMQATIQSITNNTNISGSNIKAENMNIGDGNVIRQGISALSKGAQSSQ